MSNILVINDILNNQFMFYHYLEANYPNILDYLNNNNIDLNYYCAYSAKISSTVSYLITSSTIKKKYNGFRLIVIHQSEHCELNAINNSQSGIKIFYDNIVINISNSQSEQEFFQTICSFMQSNNIHCAPRLYISNNKLVNNYIYDYYGGSYCNMNGYFSNYISCNEHEDNVTSIYHCTNTIYLKIFNNLKYISLNLDYMFSRANFPISLKAIKLDYYHDYNLNMDSLPLTLHTIYFNSKLNVKINKGFLPDSINTIIFKDYNMQIDSGILPKNLHVLRFGDRYNTKIDFGVLPEFLLELSFGDCYNIQIDDGVLPNSLIKLSFGKDYNKPIKVLPSSLKTLIFKGVYNTKINVGELPNTLRTLIFSDSYTKKLNLNVLPNSLKKLVLGARYYKAIKPNILPNSLEKLEFGYEYNEYIGQNILPNKLRAITFSSNYDHYFDQGVLPKSVKKIIFCGFEDKDHLLAEYSNIKIVYKY
jgi:hypothetical protein